MAEHLSIIVKAIFIENLALAFFLGMCTFLAVSQNVKTALGLGVAVIVIQGITVPVNYLIYQYLLADGAWSWAGYPEVNLEFLGLISYIGVISLAAGDRTEKIPLPVFRLVAGVIDIGGGGLTGCLLGINAGHAYTQCMVNGTHPVTVPLGQIIVNGDQMAALSSKSIQVERQGSYQSFPLTSFHLSYLPLVKDNSPH